uniref:Uncharacterized protein n=1 Tax=Serratia phage Kevin TaxID=3161161 RepID=A0AAU8KYT9_9CAUD
MKDILQPIIDEAVASWNKEYPQLLVSVTAKQFMIESGRVVFDGSIGIRGLGVTDGFFDIGSDALSWNNPHEFYIGVTECIEESMLAHSQYQKNHESRSL